MLVSESNSFHLLELNVPIFEQLKIEEALLRADDHNWCLINYHFSEAIVLGITGKPEELLFISKVKEDHIPVIRRFSGGGTVFVDSGTIFITWIKNSIISSPEKIMKEVFNFYNSFFKEPFSLKNNDFTWGDKKIAGNAQYLQKNRWLHHSSFLWDMDLNKIERFLKIPSKQPEYRKHRSHRDFLFCLKTIYPERESFLFQLKEFFFQKNIVKKDLINIDNILTLPHRQATVFLNL